MFSLYNPIIKSTRHFNNRFTFHNEVLCHLKDNLIIKIQSKYKERKNSSSHSKVVDRILKTKSQDYQSMGMNGIYLEEVYYVSSPLRVVRLSTIDSSRTKKTNLSLFFSCKYPFNSIINSTFIFFSFNSDDRYFHRWILLFSITTYSKKAWKLMILLSISEYH